MPDFDRSKKPPIPQPKVEKSEVNKPIVKESDADNGYKEVGNTSTAVGKKVEDRPVIPIVDRSKKPIEMVSKDEKIKQKENQEMVDKFQ